MSVDIHYVITRRFRRARIVPNSAVLKMYLAYEGNLRLYKYRVVGGSLSLDQITNTPYTDPASLQWRLPVRERRSIVDSGQNTAYGGRGNLTQLQCIKTLEGLLIEWLDDTLKVTKDQTSSQEVDNQW